MPDNATSSSPDISGLETAFQSIAQSIAVSIVDALVQPLRQEIESRVNAIILDATRDVHSKIAAAIGQIQPINIPINLLAQPVVQPLYGSPQVTRPEVLPTTEKVDVPAAPAPAVVTPAPVVQAVVQPLEPVGENRIDHKKHTAPAPVALVPIKRGKDRTPKKSSKNFGATIVGLLPGQAHMIKNDFKFAKLSFVSADARNSTQLVALSKSQNVVIFMTDFIRHAAVESVRAVHGNWVYVSGGMSSLREKLQELYQHHQSSVSLLVSTPPT